MTHVVEETFPFRIAGRYEVRDLLGRGGMASVYKAWDFATGSAVALKRLTVDSHRSKAVRTVELFEREFHTLVQLAHPRIVRALDYGVEDGQPYYTLELLDGGDLRELAPLPWLEVCVIAYEVCSALSLLHSRGLVHRDLTPGNVRRTQSGQAKLIDFGLLSPMGPTTLVAGTPPFVAPELVRTMSLDGRSDLYSLGATLYYALTKRPPYPARTVDQLQDAWRSSPPRPSGLVPGVPPALDELLLGMLRLDVGSRPKSASEVMDRLLPLLAAPPEDALRAASACIVAPKLVGRDSIVARFRRRMLRVGRGRGGGFALVGGEGTGRSRMLDAFVLEAKLVGATAVRAGPEDAARPFGVAASLALQVHRAAPALARAAAAANPASELLYAPAGGHEDPGATDLVDVTRPDLDRAELQAALRTWILEFSTRRALAIAVDDLDRIDEPSAALLAALTWEAPSRRLAYLAVLPAHGGEKSDGPIGIVRNHAEEIHLDPLRANEVTALLVSLFGNVPNVGALSARFAALCAGRPRECVMFAQYLVDAGAISYAEGTWTLPVEIPETLLPENLEAAFALRVAKLGERARHVAALLGENLLERLSRADLLSLRFATPAQVDAAIDELTAARLAVGDPAGYAPAGAAITRLLNTSLAPDEKRRIHDELSVLHEAAGRHPLLVAYHAISGSGAEGALDRLARETPSTEARTVFILGALEVMSEASVAKAMDLATRTAEQHGRPPSELQSLRALLASTAARGADPVHFYGVAERWLRQAKHDSGYDDWLALDPTMEPMPRAMMAVGAAIQRHGDTPEASRGMPPQEGIQQLVAYVLFAVAIASRALDRRLQTTLAEVVEPFAPLNPMLAAVLADARATCMIGEGRREAAQTAFADVLTQLESVSGAELRYVEAVRTAVCYALAAIDTTLGLRSERLSRYVQIQDRNHQVSALFLQKLAALQQGDWELAEKYRQEGELLSLQTNAPSMFSTLGDELEVHAMARDLTGLRRVRAGVAAMAEKFPGWIPMLRVADAHYLRLCGDLDGALEALAPALADQESGTPLSAWTTWGRVLAVRLLCDLCRNEEAVSLGLSELAFCESRGMRQQARNLSLSIAEAEAALGRFEDARRRVDAAIAEQVALGVAGLQLGQSYEARARVAIAEKDGEAFHRFTALASEQYHPGRSSVLGALYERLMDAGRQAGLVDSFVAPAGKSAAEPPPRSTVHLTSLVSGCDTPSERADRALTLLCEGDPPTTGYLLVSTDRGLTLAASNAPATSLNDLVAFASERLERERRVSDMETSALSSLSAGTHVEEWRDAQGTRYELVLLGTTLSDDFCIGGVALLAANGPPRAGKLGPVAEAIARALIESGDAVRYDSA